ncbi:MAG: hypothetical protein CMJ96_04305 [Planctomycetes bacterium]|nr:hypothetical protein [Planctomycetota bacterium]
MLFGRNRAPSPRCAIIGAVRFVPILFLLVACSEPDNSTSHSAEATVIATSENGPIVFEDLEDALDSWELVRDVEIDFSLPRQHVGDDEDPVPVDFDFLGAWEFSEDLEDPFPIFIHELQGKRIRLRGFMMPDLDFENITRFHLIRSLWGCCFGAPPRVNELLSVNVRGGEGLDYTYNTIEVTGTFRAEFLMEDGIIEDIYFLDDTDVEVLDEFDDPDAPAMFDPAVAF